MRLKFRIPKGFHHSAQGWPRRGLPWDLLAKQNDANPERQRREGFFTAYNRGLQDLGDTKKKPDPSPKTENTSA